MDVRTRRAVETLRAGDLESARKELAAALLEDRGNAEAWWWLAVAAETDSERLACLRQVLALDPGNQPVARALITLERRMRHPPRPRSHRLATPRPAPATASATPGGDGAPARPVRRGHYATARHTPRYYPPGRAPERLLFAARPSLAVTVFVGLAGLLLAVFAWWLLRDHRVVRFLLLLPLGVAASSVYFIYFLSRAYARYLITSTRLFLEGGLIHPEYASLSLGEAVSLSCRRSLLGGFFNTGDLLLTDQAGREYFLYAVHAPDRFLAVFEQARQANPSPPSVDP